MRPIFRSAASWRQRVGPAMALDAIEELSDEAPVGEAAGSKDKGKLTPKATEKAKKEKEARTPGSKDEGKLTPKAKEKASKKEEKVRTEAKSKAKGKAKAAPKEKANKATKAKKAEVEQTKEEEEASEEQVSKKPAAKTVPKKRPAAQSDVPPASKVRKATKYLYHAEGKWGIKLDGRELGTAAPPKLFNQGLDSINHAVTVVFFVFEALAIRVGKLLQSPES